MIALNLFCKKGGNIFMKEQNLNMELIDSVGIEVEFSNFDRQCKRFNESKGQRLPGFKIVHDASCESPADLFADTSFTIKFDNEEDRDFFSNLLNRTIIGGEIISPIAHSKAPEWVQSIYELCNLLYEFGEDEESVRDSFHVHVNVSRSIPLRALKNLLRLTATFEAILFRLGGMGRMNRGVENHYCFCRPFLGNGPAIVEYRNPNDEYPKNYPIMVYEDLMSAETKQDFFDRFGNSHHHAQRKKRYITPRYMCVNFYPVLTQGSFEFRTANKTLNPEYIIAWTNFCKAFVEKAFWSKEELDYEDKVRPLHENREISDDEFLLALSYLDSLDEDTNSVLLEIWQKSPTPLFDNLLRFTHLREPTRWGCDYLPKPLPRKTEIMQAEFLDIHHFENVPQQREGRRNQGFDANIPPDVLNDLIRRVGADNVPQRFAVGNARQVKVGRHDFANQNTDQINVHEMQDGWICTYGYEGVDFTFSKDGLDITMQVIDHDDEVNHNIRFRDPQVINLDYLAEQFYEGIHPNDWNPN
jgi:hypothetical protein